MSNDDLNNKVLNNPFTIELLNASAISIANFDKRKGFNINQNNHQLLNFREKYIININALQSKLITTIEQVNFVKTFIKRFPDKKYFADNGINQLTYIQYHTEVLSHKVHTILEIMKLLVNEVYSLNIKHKDCSWSSLIAKLNKNEPCLKVLDEYFKTFENIIEVRHLNTHRGIYNDTKKDTIELGLGLSVYELHDRLNIQTDQDFIKLFPKWMIELEITSYRKDRLALIQNILESIYVLVNKFLTSLHDKFLEK